MTIEYEQKSKSAKSDTVITGSDSTTYFLRRPPFSNGWKKKLYRGGNNAGKPLFHMTESQGDIRIASHDGQTAVSLHQPDTFSTKKCFSYGGHSYVWKKGAGFGYSFELSKENSSSDRNN